MKPIDDDKTEKPDKAVNDKAPGLVFPCEIGVKIFINKQVEAEQLLKQFVLAQLGKDELVKWTSRESSAGKYLAITALLNTPSREHIDAFYQALYDCEHVIMTI